MVLFHLMQIGASVNHTCEQQAATGVKDQEELKNELKGHIDSMRHLTGFMEESASVIQQAIPQHSPS